MQDRLGFGWGPTRVILWLIDWLVDLIVIYVWFILLYDLLEIIS